MLLECYSNSNTVCTAFVFHFVVFFTLFSKYFSHFQMHVQVQLYPCTASPLALREWMTVIDAAIQGVPEQAKRRLRTVTIHFSMRQGKPPPASELPVCSYSTANLDERGLDLVTSSASLEDADNACNGRVDAE